MHVADPVPAKTLDIGEDESPLLHLATAQVTEVERTVARLRAAVGWSWKASHDYLIATTRTVAVEPLLL